jgi:cell division protein FtsI (penicillin-binding protein 3)
MQSRTQLIVIIVTLLFLFSLLIYRFATLQLVEEKKWQKVADGQHFFLVQEPFQRGCFYGKSYKTGEPKKLVYDLLRHHLYVDPQSIGPDYHEEIIQELTQILGIDGEILKDNLNKKSRSRKIGAWLTDLEKEKIQRFWTPFAKKNKIPKNALYFAADYKRSYPYGEMLGQVLHTIQYQKDATTKQGVPTGGLELYFDSFLRGKLGVKKRMRSPVNQFEIGQMIKEPQDGADVYLTIDPVIQAICEEEIQEGVTKFKAKRGWAVMMDPKSGKILSLAQYPPFYPPAYPLYFSSQEKAQDTRVKSILDMQEPGSIFKSFTIALALLANQELSAKGHPPLFDVEEKIPTKEGHFPGRRKVIADVVPSKFCNMYMGFQKSSNIYMAHLMERLVDRLGEQWIRDCYTKRFGFGEKTGIELPAEAAGAVPRINHFHPNGTLEWSKATPYSLGMGHNILVTSIQMLRAYSVFANGGSLVKPTLIEKITRKKGGKEEVLVSYGQRSLIDFPKVLDLEVIEQVIKALKYSGTARKGDVPGYTEAVKSSTAKKVIQGKYSETQYIPSFVGFTPVDDAKIVLIVTLDEPYYGYIKDVGKNHHGGTCCAPVFSKIAYRTLKYLGVPEDDPYGYPAGDPRRDPKKAHWLKELGLLKQKYDSWNN